MFRFPFTNFHELNLDWILKVVKEATTIFETGRADLDYAVETANEAKEIATQAAEAQVADNSISTVKLQDASVTTLKIHDGAVTAAKLAAGAVTAQKIANDSVAWEKLTPELRERITEIANEYNKLGFIVVDAAGNGDYTTISAAVAASEEDDIILVKPGRYVESVHAYDKNFHMFGIDKRSCILQYSGYDYTNPPLEIAKGSIENMTFNAMASGNPSANPPAYAVHIDSDYSANSNLTFRNCRFFNAVHQGVGIGLRVNFNLLFDGCEFETTSQAALYCHDWETGDTSVTKTPQLLTVINSILYNNSTNHATIMLQSQELETDCARALFRNNTIINAGSGGEISMTLWANRHLTNNSFMGSSDWRLQSSSGFNTAEELNSAAAAYPINQNNLAFYKNIKKHRFKNDTPLKLYIPLYQGCLLIGMLQGVGFIMLQVYHGNGTSTIRNVVTGVEFSSSYYSFTVQSDGITITTTTTSWSEALTIDGQY